MQGIHELIPGEDNLVQFVLYTADGTALQTSATIAAGDFKITVDGGTASNVTNAIVNEGNGVYSCTIDSTETSSGDNQLTLTGDDATATETFLGTAVACRVLSLSEVGLRYYAGPEGPGVHVDSGGTAGSTLGTHGTHDNPTTTWANALTLASKLGVNRFYIGGSTSVTMTGSVAEYEFFGEGEFANNTVNLGSQNCTNASFENLEVTGTQGSGTARAQFTKCYINAVTTLHAAAFQCGINGTSTLSSNDDHVFEDCFSMVAGGGTPGLTLAANVDVSMRHYSGGVQFNSGAVTNNVSLEGMGQLIIDATCTNFTISVRGLFQVTDNGSSTTINDNALYNRTLSTTNANVTQIDGVALAAHTAGIFPAEITSPIGGVNFTVGSTDNSTVSCSSGLSGTYTTDNTFQNRVIVWLTGSLAGSVCFIEAYDGSTGVLTFSEAVGTPANTDTGVIL